MVMYADERYETAIKRHSLHLQTRETAKNPEMGVVLRRLCQILVKEASAEQVSQLCDAIQRSLEYHP